MAEQDAKNPNEDEKKVEQSPIVTPEIKEPVKPIEEKPNTNDTKNDDTKEKGEAVPETTKAKRSAAYFANWLTALGITVNVILIFFTIRLYREAVSQSQAATDAANAAIESNRIARETMETNNTFSQRNIAMQEADAKSGDTINKKTIEVAQQSLQAQINSLKETQRQFDTENMPYLECKEFTFLTFEPNKPPKIAFQIINFGKTAAKIIKYKVGFFYSPIIQFKPQGYLATIPFDPIPAGLYVTSQYPAVQIMTANNSITQEAYNQAIAQKTVMIMCGEIDYINEINSKKRKHIFNVVLYPPPSKETKMVYLENIDEK